MSINDVILIRMEGLEGFWGKIRLTYYIKEKGKNNHLIIFNDVLDIKYNKNFHH